MKCSLRIKYSCLYFLIFGIFYFLSPGSVRILKKNDIVINRYACTFEILEFTERGNHDCTFVGERIWSFDAPRDGGWVVSVKPDGRDGKRIFQTAFYDDGFEVEMKSVDCAHDCLLVGNGSAISWREKDSSEHCAYIFYDYLEWETISKNATIPITFDNCGAYTKVNLSQLGSKIYAFYGGGKIFS